jgi:hypothetical protein
VHQNLTFPVHPDPVSGHALLAPGGARAQGRARRPGDVHVDAEKSTRAYEAWLAKARPADRHSPDGTRRPSWLIRPVKPVPAAYRLP